MQFNRRLAASAVLICAAGASIAAPNESAAAVNSAARSIKPASLARAREKLDRAQQVVQQFSARAAAEGLAETWRAELLSALMQGSEESITRVQGVATARQALSTAHDVAHSSDASSQPKALGDATVDLTFIPLSIPCRIVDTRVAGAGGTLAAGETRAFLFGVSAAQGSSSCSPFIGYEGDGEPAAAAVTVTVDATGSSARPGSFIKVFPDGGSTPTSWLNFGGGEIIANAGILSLADDDFDIKVSGATNVIVDVFGSFIEPQATALDCKDTDKVTGSLTAGASLLLTSGACPASYTIASGSCFGGDRQPGYALEESTITAENTWLCTWASTGTTTQNVAVSSHCCRVPGRY